MNLLIRLTAAITLLAVVTVIAEAGQNNLCGVMAPDLNELSVVRMSDFRMADGGRTFEVNHPRFSSNGTPVLFDARGDPVDN